MHDLIVKAAMNLKITDNDIADALYEMCDNVHASCNSECLVYHLNYDEVPDTVHNFEINRGCDCFKNGLKMLAFIRKRLTM